FAEARLLQFGEAGLDGGLAGDIAGPVDLLRDRLDLVAQRHRIRVQELELGLAAVGELDDGAGEIGCPLAAAGPVVSDYRLDTFLGAQLLEPAELGIGIGAEAIDRHHRRYAEPPQILEMALQIGKALLNRRDILLLE